MRSHWGQAAESIKIIAVGSCLPQALAGLCITYHIEAADLAGFCPVKQLFGPGTSELSALDSNQALLKLQGCRLRLGQVKGQASPDVMPFCAAGRHACSASMVMLM